MNDAIALLVLLSTVLLGCVGEDSGEPQGAVNEFAAGQVWTYETRSGEEASRLVICRVEPNEKLGTIVHVHVEGVAVQSPGSPDGVSAVVGHMPFAEATLRESVRALEPTRESLPDYEEGYGVWKQAFDDGKAGIFTISVAAGVAFMEEALSR